MTGQARPVASLSRRLLIAAGVGILVAVLGAGTAIALSLQHLIRRTVDERLDTQLLFLASTVHAGPDGTLRLDGNADGPPFDRPGRGWYWQIIGATGSELRARALGAASLAPPDVAPAPTPPPPPGPPPHARPPAPPLSASGPGPDGRDLYYRSRSVTVDGVTARIVVSAPRSALTGPLIEAISVLVLSLGLLTAALILAMMLQVRLGLRPLAKLRAAIADVRAGTAERVPPEQPSEVQPLVAELNALLEQNAANLERARRHVANLAHGLKTPLATLTLAMSRKPGDPELIELVELMDRRIRHHLGRARAAALSGPVRARTVVSDRLGALADILSKVNAARGIVLHADVPDALAVACEQQDLDEIVGNILDNAFKWSRGKVAVAARSEGTNAVIVVDDDGPGLTPDQAARVVMPGQRLDEAAPGFGFGLAITRELVELYGGRLDFDRALLGGLRVLVRLPLAGKAARA
jgi:signal transduction histidine kinase